MVDEKPEMIEKMPKYVFDLVDFHEFPSQVGQIECVLGEFDSIITAFWFMHMYAICYVLTMSLF
jgi:hypothetical protein